MILCPCSDRGSGGWGATPSPPQLKDGTKTKFLENYCKKIYAFRNVCTTSVFLLQNTQYSCPEQARKTCLAKMPFPTIFPKTFYSASTTMVAASRNLQLPHLLLCSYTHPSGGGRWIIGWAHIHIFVFTDLGNNWFQKEILVQKL